MQVKILVTSPPDREDLVAEVWIDDCQLAELSWNESAQVLELYPHPRGVPWRVPFETLHDALMAARTRLAEVEGRC